MPQRLGSALLSALCSLTIVLVIVGRESKRSRSITAKGHSP
jgi:hypothetical protein